MVSFSVEASRSAELAQQICESYALHDGPTMRADLDVNSVVEELSPDTPTGTPAISISKSPLLANQTFNLSIL